MTLLDWQPVRRGDREALKRFACTEPKELRRVGSHLSKEYARPWEAAVQARIRTASEAPQPPEYMLLGWDSGGVGAALYYEELDGPALVEVRVAAVANRHRQQGGGVADEMMTKLLDALTERALELGVDIVEVGTWVHEKNRASQALCRRFNLRQTALADDLGLQRWARTVPVAGADIGEG